MASVVLIHGFGFSRDHLSPSPNVWRGIRRYTADFLSPGGAKSFWNRLLHIDNWIDVTKVISDLKIQHALKVRGTLCVAQNDIR